MTEYKLVPVEPTQEMIDEGRTARTHPRERYKAMLAAAPDVQGEPVGEVRFELGAPSSIFVELYSKSLPDLSPGTKLYAEQQPVDQHPITSGLAYDASRHLTNWLNMNLCECEGGHTCGRNEVQRTRDALLTVAERQPDVTQLVEALETTAEKLKLVMETAQYIQHTIDKALAPAREALAAYRKGVEA